MGNPKEWEAGEMSGEKLRNHSFQEKRGGSRCGRQELRFGPPPPPTLSLKRLWSHPHPFLKEACTLFSRMCLSFAADVLICYFCLFALLFFSFLLFLVKKRRPKLC